MELNRVISSRQISDYKTKYKIGFYDINEKYFEIWIKLYDYDESNGATYLKGGANPCRISMSGQGEDAFTVIKGQEMAMEILCENNFDLAEFFQANEKDYLVELHPPSDFWKAKARLTGLGVHSDADPTASFSVGAYSTNYVVYARSLFQIISNTYKDPSRPAKVQLYYTYGIGINIKKVLLSEANVYYTSTPEQITTALVNNIVGDDFTGVAVSDGYGWIYSTAFDYGGYPVLNQKLEIVSTTSYLSFKTTYFAEQNKGDYFQIQVGDRQSIVISGITYYYYMYLSPRIDSVQGETVNEICERIADAVDGGEVNRNVYIYKNGYLYQDPTGIVERTIRRLYEGWTIGCTASTNTLSFVLQGAGAAGNGIELFYKFRFGSILYDSGEESSGSSPYTDTDEWQVTPLSATFSSGASAGADIILQINDGNGWVTIASYTRTTDDDIYSIVANLIDDINNNTEYTAIVDPSDNQYIIISLPEGVDGRNYQLQWVFTAGEEGEINIFTNLDYETILWKGFVLPYLYTEPYRKAPFIVNLKAFDVIGDLKLFNFSDDDGNDVEGRISLMNALLLCLNKTILSLPLYENIDIYEDSFIQPLWEFEDSSDSGYSSGGVPNITNPEATPLSQAYINSALFKGKTCYDVIEYILSMFNAKIYQLESHWCIERIPAVTDTYIRRKFSSSGVYISYELVYLESIIDGSTLDSFVINDSGILSVSKSYAKVQTLCDFGLQPQLLKYPDFDDPFGAGAVPGYAWRRLLPGDGSELTSPASDNTYIWMNTRGNGLLQARTSRFGGVDNPNNSVDQCYQEVRVEKNDTQKFQLSIKYRFDSENNGPDSPFPEDDWDWENEQAQVVVRIEDEVSGASRWLDNDGEWQSTLTSILFDLDRAKPAGQTGRELIEEDKLFEVIIKELPFTGTLRITFCSLASEATHGVMNYDYCRFSIIDEEFPAGERSQKYYTNKYVNYSDVYELEFLSGDVINKANREIVYKYILTNSSGEGTTFWENGLTLTEVCRKVLLNQLGSSSQILTADVRSEKNLFNHVIKDEQNQNRYFIPNGIEWNVRMSFYTGEWLEVKKADLEANITDVFIPTAEESNGTDVYETGTPSGSGGNGMIINNNVENNYVLPADVLKQGNIIDTLISNSYLNPLSANQGRVLNTLIENYQDWNRYGLLNQTETTIAFDDSTFVFTLGMVGTSWSYWRSGIKYTVLESKTIDLTTVEDPLVDGRTYYIYIDAVDGSLSASTGAWTLLDTKVPVAYIIWNNTMTPKYWKGEERHTCLIDRRTHYHEHFTEGTKAVATGALTGFTLNSDVNANKTFAIAQSTIADEDIVSVLAALTQPNGTNTDYVVMYRTGAGTWGWKYSNMPFVYNVGNTNDWIQWDNGGTMTNATGGSGANTRWVNSYLVLTNFEGAARYVIIPGQNIYTTLASAQAESPSSFTFTGFPIQEAVIVYRLTWTTITSSSQGQCRLAANPQKLNISAVSTVSLGTNIDHSLLTNLLSDNHTQYALLTGRNGDILKIDELQEFSSGAGIKMTKIVISDGGTIGQAAGPLLAFDDTNNYLEITGCNVGIGTVAPEYALDVVGTIRGIGERIFLSNYKNGTVLSHPVVDVLNSNGTKASPSYLLLSEEVGAIAFREGVSGSQAGGSGMAVYASEAWSATNLGADIYIFTVANGTVDKFNAMYIKNNGSIAVGANSVTANCKFDVQGGDINMLNGTTSSYRIGGSRVLAHTSGNMFMGDIDNIGGSLYIREKGANVITVTNTNVTLAGSLGVTGTRVSKGWFTDLEITNMPTVGNVSLTTVAQTFQNKTLTNSNNVLGGVTMTLGSDADGDIYYRASNVLTRLAKGTAGQVLKMNSGATAPEWKGVHTLIDAFAALTISSSATTWDCSGGLNKTVSASADFTLTLTNFASGMFGDLKLTTSGAGTITLAASGVTFKTNGGTSATTFTFITSKIYHIAWVCTSSTTIEWNIAVYE
jgi:hypothetical protein